MQTLLTTLEMLSYAVTILGVPAAIFVYLREQYNVRQEREYGTFDSLDDKYIELQTLCLDYPELDIFDTPYDEPPSLSKEKQKQEEAFLLIRVAIFERAFLMYSRTSEGARKAQWQGWEVEILEWMDRENYAKVWQEHKHYYDQAFVEYFDAKKAITPSNSQKTD